VIDDELNILPLSTHIRTITPIALPVNQVNEKGDYVSEKQSQLISLKVL
jgi:hypothetical protein